MRMDHVETASRVHEVLATFAASLVPLDDEDDALRDEMVNPVLSEWVLVANVMDLDSDEVRVGVLAAPAMLRSHIVGLLAVAEDNV